MPLHSMPTIYANHLFAYSPTNVVAISDLAIAMFNYDVL